MDEKRGSAEMTESSAISDLRVILALMKDPVEQKALQYWMNKHVEHHSAEFSVARRDLDALKGNTGDFIKFKEEAISRLIGTPVMKDAIRDVYSYEDFETYRYRLFTLRK